MPKLTKEADRLSWHRTRVGVYKVPLNSTPSSLLYLMISFGGSDNCGCGCGKFEILISFTGNTHGPSTRSFSNSSTMFKSPLSMLSAYLEFTPLVIERRLVILHVFRRRLFRRQYAHRLQSYRLFTVFAVIRKQTATRE